MSLWYAIAPYIHPIWPNVYKGGVIIFTTTKKKMTSYILISLKIIDMSNVIFHQAY